MMSSGSIFYFPEKREAAFFFREMWRLSEKVFYFPVQNDISTPFTGCFGQGNARYSPFSAPPVAVWRAAERHAMLTPQKETANADITGR
ncbi:hypothetical protein [Cronobacter sakazakii]|uniref:hypothetical protein n=1 Tax=Cronobacter sakazakii TaxID=28141 RepID=UPI0012BD7DE1|nr:hypothetical protein [Cronobacter sakazakii]